MEKEMSHPCDNQPCRSDPLTVPDISIKDLNVEISWEFYRILRKASKLFKEFFYKKNFNFIART